MYPRRHLLHTPQPEMWYTRTRSPALNRRQPGPVCTISPAGSCPAMTPLVAFRALAKVLTVDATDIGAADGRCFYLE